MTFEPETQISWSKAQKTPTWA